MIVHLLAIHVSILENELRVPLGNCVWYTENESKRMTDWNLYINIEWNYSNSSWNKFFRNENYFRTSCLHNYSEWLNVGKLVKISSFDFKSFFCLIIQQINECLSTCWILIRVMQTIIKTNKYIFQLFLYERWIHCFWRTRIRINGPLWLLIVCHNQNWSFYIPIDCVIHNHCSFKTKHTFSE